MVGVRISAPCAPFYFLYFFGSPWGSALKLPTGLIDLDDEANVRTNTMPSSSDHSSRVLRIANELTFDLTNLINSEEAPDNHTLGSSHL